MKFLNKYILTFLFLSFFINTNSTAQIPWPEKPQNLQALPKETTTDQLKDIMFSFSGALGVNCVYCHVATDRRDFSTYNFSTDRNPNKQKARVMIQMVNKINNETISMISSISENKETLKVDCRTCHRGYNRPIPLENLLYEKIKKDGVDKALEEYEKLRKRYYGKDTFNFDENALTDLSVKLKNEKMIAEAVKIIELNLSLYSDLPTVQDTAGDIYEAVGEYKKAVACAEKAIDLIDNVLKINDTFHKQIKDNALAKINRLK